MPLPDPLEITLFFTKPDLFSRIKGLNYDANFANYGNSFLERNFPKAEHYLATFYKSTLKTPDDDQFDGHQTIVKSLGGGASGAFVFLIIPHNDPKYLIKIYFDAFAKFGNDVTIRNDRPIRETYSLSMLNGVKGFPTWDISLSNNIFLIDPNNPTLWNTFFTTSSCKTSGFHNAADLRGMISLPSFPVLACSMSLAPGKSLMDLKTRDPEIDPIGLLLELIATYQRFSRRMGNGVHWDLHPDNIFIDLKNPPRTKIPTSYIKTFFEVDLETETEPGNQNFIESVKAGLRWADDWVTWVIGKILKPFEKFIAIGEFGLPYLRYFKKIREVQNKISPKYRIAAVIHYLLIQLQVLGSDDLFHAKTLFQKMFGQIVRIDLDFDDLSKAVFIQKLNVDDFVNLYAPHIHTTFRKLYAKKDTQYVTFPTITLIDFDLVTCDAFPILNNEHKTKLNAMSLGCLTERMLTWLMQNLHLIHVELILRFLRNDFIPFMQKKTKNDAAIVDHCHLLAYTFVFATEALRRNGIPLDIAFEKVRSLIVLRFVITNPKTVTVVTPPLLYLFSQKSSMFMNFLLLNAVQDNEKVFSTVKLGTVIADAYSKLTKYTPLAPDDIHFQFYLEQGNFNIFIEPMKGDFTTVFGTFIPQPAKLAFALGKFAAGTYYSFLPGLLQFRGFFGFLLNFVLRLIGVLLFGEAYGYTGEKQLHLVNIDPVVIQTTLRNKQFSARVELNLAVYLERNNTVLSSKGSGPEWLKKTRNAKLYITQGSFINTPQEINKYLILFRSLSYHTITGGTVFRALFIIPTWSALFLKTAAWIGNAYFCESGHLAVHIITSKESIPKDFETFVGDYDKLKEKNSSGSIFVIEQFLPNSDPLGIFTCLDAFQNPFSGLSSQLDCLAAVTSIMTDPNSLIAIEDNLFLTPNLKVQLFALNQPPMTIAQFDKKGTLSLDLNFLNSDTFIGDLITFLQDFSLAKLALDAVKFNETGPVHDFLKPWMKMTKNGINIAELIGILTAAQTQFGDSFFTYGDPHFFNFVEATIGPLYWVVGIVGLGSKIADFAILKTRFKIDELKASLVQFLDTANNIYKILFADPNNEEKVKAWQKLIVQSVLDRICGSRDIKWNVYKRLVQLPKFQTDIFYEADEFQDIVLQPSDFEDQTQIHTTIETERLSENEISDESDDSDELPNESQVNQENDIYYDAESGIERLPSQSASPPPHQPIFKKEKENNRRSDSGFSSQTPP